MSSLTKKAVSLLLLSILVYLLTACLSSSDNQKTEQQKQSPAQVATAPALLEVSALQLFRDYDANEVSADQKYKDKTIVVSGKVDDISKDVLDDMQIVLATDNEFMPVHCDFGKTHEAELASLKKGMIVRIQGKVQGKIMGSPMLQECSFAPEKKEPVTPPQANPTTPSTPPPAPVAAQPTAANNDNANCEGLGAQDSFNCWADRYDAADKELNRLWKIVMAKLDDKAKNQLREQQRTWLTGRTKIERKM